MAYHKTISLSPQINPRLTLSWIYTLFAYRKWDVGYGGKKWAEITKVALLEYDTPKEIFIDTVINLEHNGGECLNKRWPLFYLDRALLRNYLNRRAQTDFDVFRDMVGVMPYPLYKLIERGQAMGIFPAVLCAQAPFTEDFYPTVIDFPKYRPLQWGEGVLISEDIK